MARELGESAVLAQSLQTTRHLDQGEVPVRSSSRCARSPKALVSALPVRAPAHVGLRRRVSRMGRLPRRSRTGAAAATLVWLLVGCAAGADRGPQTAATSARASTASISPRAPTPATRPTEPGTPAAPPPADRVGSVGWTSRGGRPSLTVAPSAWQRAHRDDRSINAAWEEVVARSPRADQPCMRDQYACHVRFALGRSAFHLEPWRPAVGYLQTVANGCNPGDRKDLG